MTLLVMSGLGLAIGQIYENFYLHSLTNRLEKEANFVASLLDEEKRESDQIQPLVMKWSNQLDARVTIILQDGTVIGDSEASPEAMEKHHLRPEIYAIISGEEGEKIRYSETLNEEMLYFAVPILENDSDIWGYVRLGLPVTTFAEINKNIWLTISISFAIALFIIVLMMSRLAKQMVGPIENVTAVANELARGNYQARTTEGKKDEVGQLTRSMNKLAYQLETMTSNYESQQERMATLIENMGSGLILMNTRGEITLINQACNEIFEGNTEKWLTYLYYDVIKQNEIHTFIQTVFMTEQNQRSQIYFSAETHVRHFDLYGAPILNKKGKFSGIVIVLHEITELKKLEQVRKDFVANVSHELKTPVTSIKGFTETLLDGAMETKSLREKFLTIISKESERLQRLIQDLLELSRIEQQYFTLNWQMIDMEEVLAEVIDLLGEKAKEKNVLLELNIKGDPVIEGDSERLKQVVINLVTNAIMYTPSDGKVTNALEGKENEVKLKVIDTGRGMSETDLPRIFERFYRVDRARSRQSGGTGLGLAIVKHLIEAHHGSIEVKSELEIGTTFTITLNRKREDVPV